MSQMVFVHPDASADRLALLNAAFPLAIEADAILKAAKREKRKLTVKEAELVEKVEKMREEIIQVDSFERLGTEVQQGPEWNADMRPAMAKLQNMENESKAA